MKSARQKVAGLLIATVLATMVLFSAPAAVPHASAEANGGTTINMGDADAGGWTVWGYCSSSYRKSSIIAAKRSFRQECGHSWQHDSGRHRCDWNSKGWKCSYR